MLTQHPLWILERANVFQLVLHDKLISVIVYSKFENLMHLMYCFLYVRMPIKAFNKDRDRPSIVMYLRRCGRYPLRQCCCTSGVVRLLSSTETGYLNHISNI